MKNLIVSESFLDDAIKKSSTALVGIVMKRFETLENPKDLKSAVKELIYEHFRDVKKLILAFNCGVTFKIKPKEKE